MKDTTACVDYIYPLVAEAMPKYKNQYKNTIRDFIETRSDELYDVAPYSRILFGAKERDAMFDALHIDIKNVTEGLSHTFYWSIANFNPRAAKDEFTMTLLMIIRYFLIKGEDKDAELSSIYLAFSGKFYASIHSQKFKYLPQKHIMEYVINNMLTQKFDLKRTGSIFGSIRSICNTWLNTYKDKLKEDSDDEFRLIIQQLHGRIKSFLGNICSLYMKAHEEGNYLSYDSDSNEEDSFRVTETLSTKAEKYVENTMNYINTNSVNYKICTMAHDSNVRSDEIRSIIESIQDDPDNIPIIKELCRITINEFMNDNKGKDLNNDPVGFISKSIAAKPNTKNPNIIRQKEIIETWLDENSPQYRKRKSRTATKSSYFKSVLKYYVLIMSQANK